MIINAGTGGTESVGKIHNMAERWDFAMYAVSIVVLVEEP